MRIKLGYPLLLRHVAEQSESLLVMAENADCLQAITHFTTDSRDVLPGDLFIALVTDTGDGHLHLHDAVSRGASAVLCCPNRLTEEPACCRLLCRDTTEALANWAKAYAATIPHTTIAVTGSVGKTTTRRFISSVLREKFSVHESPHNYNNLLGCSLTLLSMPRQTDYLVAECGMNAPGEISNLSKLIEPDIAVITNVGISHVAGLGSRDAIGYEKLCIADGMRGGLLLAAREDAFLSAHAPRDTLFVSLLDCTDGCRDVREDIQGISFTYQTSFDASLHFHIPTVGMHTLSCAVFAIRIGILLDMTEEEIRRGLARYTPAAMRQSILKIGDYMFLSDAYNACPASMLAADSAVKVYRRERQCRTIAVLGDMYELGDESERYHREIGAYFANAGYHHLFFWGDFAPYYYQGATMTTYPTEQITQFRREEEVSCIADILLHDCPPPCIILLKGSRRMKMERVISHISKLLS